jgi:hypothetical protein
LPPCKSAENSNESFYGQPTSIAEIMTFWVMHFLLKGPFFLNMGSEDAEFFTDFQKYLHKLTLVLEKVTPD